MTKHLLGRYGGAVPRYTSYPTAPHFTGDVGPGSYQAWLSHLPEDVGPLSLYLHVPFCDTLCWFCGCHTKIVNRYEPVAAYLDLLCREIALVGKLTGRRPVGRIHLGGGSPTILKSDDMGRLRAALDAAFEILPEAEIAIEIDPRGMGEQEVAALARFGITRASLGVQDLNPEVQKAVNRIQPFDETALLVDHLRAAGIRDLNVDLMYGLPHQTVEGVERTVRQIVSLKPSRLALFGYAHVPQMKTHQKLIPEEALPGPEERLAQSEAAAAALVEAGYQRIGIDHFARPDDALAIAHREGRLGRNFQGYCDDPCQALIGLGASAIGFLPQGYVQNAAPLHLYREAVLAGRPATVRGFALQEDDRLRRDVIERLMCDFAVDLEPIRRRHSAPADAFAREMERLQPFREDRLVEVEGERLVVTDEGRPLVRSLAAVFDRYFGQKEARHSQAV